MERTEEAEGVDSGALGGAAGVGAWGTFAQMRVSCSQLLAGPFGKVCVDSRRPRSSARQLLSAHCVLRWCSDRTGTGVC